MILHLFNDEKVVNRTIEAFNTALPGINVYLCFVEDNPKLVTACDNLFFIKNRDENFDELDCNKITAIVIHFLDNRKIKFIEKFFKRVLPIYWIMWGGDFYNTLLESKGFPVYYSQRFLGWRYWIKKILALGGYQRPYEKKYSAFIKERITHCITASQEFALCLQYCNSLFKNKECITGFFYYPIDKILGNVLLKSTAKGNVILVGNSASFTNNHCYAFKYLKRINIGNRDIVTPLSYGGNLSYINYVRKKGNLIFGNHYKSLMDFLPLDEYNKLMITAEICVFSSWRQEANGNVVIALYLGAKVFMSNRSPLYAYYKSLGIKLFELEKITTESINTPLTKIEKQHNRDILLDRFCAEKQYWEIRKIFKD